MQTPGVIGRATTLALAVSLAVSLAVGAGAVAQPTPVSSDWKTLRTPHLTVVGDASAGELQRLGRDIERFRDAIASAVPAVRFDETIPTVLVVFRDDGQRTEAHAYAGIKAHIEGDRAAAQRHLAWVRTSGRREYIEYGYAVGELRRLARTGSAP